MKYHMLPEVFGGKRGFDVYTEGDLEKALEQVHRSIKGTAEIHYLFTGEPKQTVFILWSSYRKMGCFSCTAKCRQRHGSNQQNCIKIRISFALCLQNKLQINIINNPDVVILPWCFQLVTLALLFCLLIKKRKISSFFSCSSFVVCPQFCCTAYLHFFLWSFSDKHRTRCQVSELVFHLNESKWVTLVL